MGLGRLEGRCQTIYSVTGVRGITTDAHREACLYMPWRLRNHTKAKSRDVIACA